jgi:hypothetical protein
MELLLVLMLLIFVVEEVMVDLLTHARIINQGQAQMVLGMDLLLKMVMLVASVWN